MQLRQTVEVVRILARLSGPKQAKPKISDPWCLIRPTSPNWTSSRRSWCRAASKWVVVWSQACDGNLRELNSHRGASTNGRGRRCSHLDLYAEPHLYHDHRITHEPDKYWLLLMLGKVRTKVPSEVKAFAIPLLQSIIASIKHNWAYFTLL